MKRCIIAICGCVLGFWTQASEIGFIEAFSLADDRATVLKDLIPGTDEAYYFRALHAQNTGASDQFHEVMGAWQRARNGQIPARARELLNRQAVLEYATVPKQSLDYIKKQLDLHFDHARERGFRESDAPTSLDNQVISTARVLKQRLATDPSGVEQIEDAGLRDAVAASLNESQRRSLLARLKRPDDVSGLVDLILADLKTHDSRGFGHHPIHKALTTPQLDDLVRRDPGLRDQSLFVTTYLEKLGPVDEADPETDSSVREAYLDRLWQFASTLSPAYNSIKAQILYHRLQHDWRKGVYDRDRFIAYLKLPRDVIYLRAEMRKAVPRADHLARLTVSVLPAVLPPISNEEPLVRAFLQQFLRDADSYEGFRSYLQDDFLKQIFAETKILYGVGDVQQWAVMLGPDAYQKVKERVEIRLATDNPALFSLTDPVRLTALVKHVSALLVNIYEINTYNVYRETGRPLDLAINLDGLAPTHSRRFTYTEPAEQRVARIFDFPEIQGRGAYVIEFIGNGQSSRALVQKGRLGVLQEITAAGHRFTVVDEVGERVRDVEGWLGGHVFTVNSEGQLVVPFSRVAQKEGLVVRHGTFATLCQFEHLAEKYTLHAGVYVDREALLSGERATIALRPVVQVNGQPVSLKLLETPRLTVRSVDLYGVVTEKVFPTCVLREDAETIQEIRVPQNTVELRVSLDARIQNLSLNQKTDLSDEARFTFNGINRTMTIADLYAGYHQKGYFVEMRGKNGEPLSGEPLRCSFKHDGFRPVIPVLLKTDLAGRAQLGALKDVDWFRIETATGMQRTFHTQQEQVVYPAVLQGAVGDTLRLPLTDDLDLEEVSLLELRRGTFVRDWHEALTVSDHFLELKELPAGDYSLFIRPFGQEITVRMTKGEKRNGYVFSTHRALETPSLAPLHVTDLSVQRDGVEIQLANVSPFTRVHLFATRYLPAYDLVEHLGFSGMPALVQQPWQVARTFYQSGREIGDEYRYILDRRQLAIKYPGNLLERPSLLLNAWAVRETDAKEEALALGRGYGGQADGLRQLAARTAERASMAMAVQEEGSTCDFLQQAAVTLYNLVPDKTGRIRVPREKVKGLSYLRVMAIDPVSTVVRDLAIEETPVTLRDLRLESGLSSDKTYAEQKLITPVQASGTVVVNDASSARFEIYDTVEKVYQLLATLNPDPAFKVFAFVTQWPSLSDDEQQQHYAKHACHELNCFLYYKDPRFFEQTIAPLLRNKRDKTFMDHWLLGDDLREYLAPWQFGRLNAAERALLGQRVREEQRVLARDARERAELIPPDPEAFDRRFDTAVQSGSLEAEPKSMAGAMAASHVKDKAALVAVDAPAMANEREETEELPSVNGAKRRSLSQMDLKKAKLETGVAGTPAERQQVRSARTPEARFFDGAESMRKTQRRFFQELERTKEWAENNYWNQPIAKQEADWVKANGFWADFAAQDSKTPFLSAAFPETATHFTEMMLALAVLQVPFKAGAHDETFKAGCYTVRAASPLILFHREIREAVPGETPGGVLVAQHVFRADDRERFDGNERMDKYVTEEFLPRVVYGTQVVLTNPTGRRQKLHLLLQIPQGAIAVNSGFTTRGIPVTLSPYSTQTHEYFYYFPKTGTFTHYPVTLSIRDQVVGAARPMTFHVVDVLNKADTTSWAWVSQNGTPEEVLAYLRTANLYRLDLEKIAWRLKDRAFFDQVIALLTARHLYHDTLWSYSVLHQVPDVMCAYLSHSPFATQCGLWLETPLLKLDPIARFDYQHLEYAPLVNARAHQVGAKRTILNMRFREQYQQFLRLLSYKPTLSAEDLLAVTYYLTLQDRVGEALAWFARVDRTKVAEQLQYDYLSAYLAFYRGDVAFARQVAQSHAQQEVPHWRTRFAQVLAQLDELSGAAVVASDQESRDQTQAVLAATEPSLTLRVEAGEIHFDVRQVKTVTVNLYPMDVELLFSRNPFLQEGSAQFAYIQPAWSRVLDVVADGQGQLTLALPPEYSSRNVMVEGLAGGVRCTQAYYANTLNVQMIETYGRLRVTHALNGQAVARAYVKVYARQVGGKVVFYKDGYTDLRGCFDYVSLNTGALAQVERLAVLVLSEELGAVVREASAPKQ